MTKWFFPGPDDWQAIRDEIVRKNQITSKQAEKALLTHLVQKARAGLYPHTVTVGADGAVTFAWRPTPTGTSESKSGASPASGQPPS